MVSGCPAGRRYSSDLISRARIARAAVGLELLESGVRGPALLVVTGLEQGRLTVVEKPGKGTMVEQHLSTLHVDTANIHVPAEQSFADVVGQIEHVVETQRNAEQGR